MSAKRGLDPLQREGILNRNHGISTEESPLTVVSRPIRKNPTMLKRGSVPIVIEKKRSPKHLVSSNHSLYQARFC